MTSREDMRAASRQAQKGQFQESAQDQPPLTSAQLDSIDPSTGLDIVQLTDGGTATGQRIFSAGHPPGTFVRATQAPGGQVTLDWRNAPDIPVLVEDEEKKRSFKKKKEVDPADVPVLFITKETKQESVSCRCTTYKKNAEGKYQEVCDGSGLKGVPAGKWGFVSNGVAGQGLVDDPAMLPDYDVVVLKLNANVAVLPATTSLLAQALKMGVHVVLDIAPAPFSYNQSLSTTNGSDGRISSMTYTNTPVIPQLGLPFESLLNPILGSNEFSFPVSRITFAQGSNPRYLQSQASVLKLNTPFSVSSWGSGGLDLTGNLGALGIPFHCNLPIASQTGTSLSWGGALAMFWSARQFNSQFKGNLVFAVPPLLDIRLDANGNYLLETLDEAGIMREWFGSRATAPVIADEDFLPYFLAGRQFITKSQVASLNLNRNLPYWLPRKNPDTLPPSKETIAFWLGGCYKNPIKITELTADDPYAAYLSNTPEKIYVTIKASKEFGYKDLEVKKRPWCSITTWEVDKETQTVTEQKFQNPEVVTTNQGDWQKEWAHSYDPIPPIGAKPATFNLATGRNGVSTAAQTFSLAPFIEAADPDLIPKLVNVSITVGGSGSVTSWNADNLTFTYQGSVTSLYNAKLTYTVDDEASQATSTIDLFADMIAPDMLFTFGAVGYWGVLNSYSSSLLLVSFTGGDGRGNVPGSQNGVLNFVSVDLVGINTDVVIIPGLTPSGNLFAHTRSGQAIGFNPLGALYSTSTSNFIWQDLFANPGFPRRYGAYGVKFTYTISNGTNQRTGNIYINVTISAPALR